MGKKFPLQPLLNLAQVKNETATTRLGQLNVAQHKTQTQLETLQQYRRDYQERLQLATLQGINPASLRNFQQFIYKLDLAISEQIKALEKCTLATQTGRRDFINAQVKLKSFDTLQHRHYSAQSQLEAKQEQKESDEHTNRMTAYKIIDAQKEQG